MTRSICSLFILVCLSACSANFPQIAQTASDALTHNNQAQMVRAIKDTLELGSTRASDLLARAGGYSQHPTYRITLPENVQPVTSRLRQFGLGGQLDRIEMLMNQGAEQAAVEAKAVFITAVRNMTVTDALGIVRGHDTAATEYFLEHTELALRQRYQPIIEQNLQQIGFYQQYQTFLSAYQQLPISNKPDLDLEQHVLNQSLNALFSQVAKEEKLIREDPVGRGSSLIGSVFK
jgi:hypothetical protein